MKKLFSILLVVIIVLSFASCGESSSDVRGTINSNNNSSTQEDTNESFSFGETEGNTWENSFIGLGCKLGDGWTFYTDEQIAELNQTTVDMVDNDTAEFLENATVIYDMFATKDNGIQSINVNLEKVGYISSALADLKKNLEATVPTIKSGLESMGMTNVVCNVTEAKIAGESYAAMDISAKIQDADFYEKLIAIKCGNYVANITIGAFDKADIDTVLTYFYSVD